MKTAKKTNSSTFASYADAVRVGIPDKPTRLQGVDLLQFSGELKRGLSENRIYWFVDKIVQQANDEKLLELLHDLFVLCVHTRSTKDGGGREKRITFILLKRLALTFPITVKAILREMPEHGYWKDPFLFLIECMGVGIPRKMGGKGRGCMGTGLYTNTYKRPSNQEGFHTANPDYWEELLDCVANMFATQLMKDMTELEVYKQKRARQDFGKSRKFGGENIVSLIASFAKEFNRSDIQSNVTYCAKWATSERKGIDRIFKMTDRIAHKIFRNIKKKPDRLKSLRKEIYGPLREHLNIPERNMCAGQWAQIEFGGPRAVNIICLQRNRAAFTNEVTHHPMRIRCPNDADRVQCRNNLLDATRIGQMTGSSNNNIARLAMRALQPKHDTLESNLIDIEYERIRTFYKKLRTERGTQSKNVVVMPDTSKLYFNDPRCTNVQYRAYVSGACVMINSLNDKNWDRVLTFETNPQWVKPKKDLPFAEKLRDIANIHCEPVTNFVSAMQAIIDQIKTKKLKPVDWPSILLVISDMKYRSVQTDQGDSWRTAYSFIKDSFAALGGNPPDLVYWNARKGITDVPGFPLRTNKFGIAYLDGYSHTILKYLITGKWNKVVSPLEALQLQLNDDSFKKIRTILREHKRELTRGFDW